MLAREVMTKEVLTFGPSTTLQEACLALAKAGISGAPVVDRSGKILGVLSETDILSHLKRLADSEVAGRYLAGAASGLAILALLSQKSQVLGELLGHLKTAMVKDAMTKGAVTAKPDSPVEEVVALMVRHDINRVPIVEGGKVLGIVTRADVVEFFGKA